MEEGKGPGCLTPSRQYGNALLGVRHQEEEEAYSSTMSTRYLGVWPSFHSTYYKSKCQQSNLAKKSHSLYTARVSLCGVKFFVFRFLHKESAHWSAAGQSRGHRWSAQSDTTLWLKLIAYFPENNVSPCRCEHDLLTCGTPLRRYACVKLKLFNNTKKNYKNGY